MGFSATLFLSPSQLQHHRSPLDLKRNPLLLVRKQCRPKRSNCIVPVARLLGPAIFEASKLKVVFVGLNEEKAPKLPRTYTLTHSDVTSKLTLAISDTINMAQGWYNRLQRDEVVAEWKKVKGKMSLHVHCHISGGHFLLDFIANLRYYIFSKELPVVLKAFVHGDVNLFNNYPELEEAPVWVYFQSNLPEFNRVECWGPLREASSIGRAVRVHNSIEGPISSPSSWVWPQRCQAECACCFPPRGLISYPHHHNENSYISTGQTQE